MVVEVLVGVERRSARCLNVLELEWIGGAAGGRVGVVVDRDGAGG